MNTENKPIRTIRIKTNGGIVQGDGFAISVNKAQYIGGIHIHDCYELEVLLDGELSTRLNGRQFDIKKGSFWLSLPNNLHHVARSIDDIEIISIKFDDSFLSNKVYNLLGMYPDGIVGRLDDAGLTVFLEMLDRIVEIYNSAKSELCKSIFIKNTIEAMLAIFIDRCDEFASETTEEMAEHNIFEAISYVKKHFTEELTANDMAKRLGYTPNYFSMKFKSLTGKNFIETVNDERLQLAYYMLSTMNISVRDVAEYVGYSSIAYFSRMFKKKFKSSPSEVKKLEHRNEEEN